MRDSGHYNSMDQLCTQTKIYDNKSMAIKVIRLQNMLKIFNIKYAEVQSSLKTCYVSYVFLHCFQIFGKFLLLLPLVFSSSCYWKL